MEFFRRLHDIRAISFDLDDTLYDNRPVIERAEQYQPVIEMPTGIDVEIVFLEGVFING